MIIGNVRLTVSNAAKRRTFSYKQGNIMVFHVT